MELCRGLRTRKGKRAEHDFARGAVERDGVAFAHDGVADAELLAVDLHCVGTHHCWGTPAASNDCRVTDEAAACGEDAFGDHHSVHVFGARLVAHEDDWLTRLGGCFGVVGGEVHLADGRTRRCRETLGDGLGLVRELRVQDGVEMVSSDAHERFFLADLPLVLASAAVLHHLHRHAQRSRASALADSCLEHPQLAVFDREFGVAHVFVVALESSKDFQQLGVHRRELTLECVEVFGVADTRDDVFTLCVDEVVAVRLVLAGCRVASETDAGARLVVAVAEHHRLHVDGGAEVVTDFFANAVGDGSRTVPRAEDGFDRTTQLLGGFLREVFAGLALDDRLVLLAEFAQL